MLDTDFSCGRKSAYTPSATATTASLYNYSAASTSAFTLDDIFSDRSTAPSSPSSPRKREKGREKYGDRCVFLFP
jgi:hypothetical protein